MHFGTLVSGAFAALVAVQPSARWELVRPGDARAAHTANLPACTIISPLAALDSEGNLTYGALFLAVTGDSAISLDGARIGVLFNTVAGVTLRAGQDTLRIGVRRSVPARAFLSAMARPDVPRVSAYLRFTDGQSAKIDVSLTGFSAARRSAASCDASQTTSAGSSARSSTLPSLATFLQSDAARRNGLARTGGWPLRDGLTNNTIKTDREPAMTLELSTRNEHIVRFGFMILGSRSPDADQLAIINQVLGTLGGTVGQANASVRTSDFATAYSAIADAPVRRLGRLRLRSGSIGGDAVLSVTIEP